MRIRHASRARAFVATVATVGAMLTATVAFIGTATPASAVLNPTPPAAPTGVVAQRVSTGIKVSWTAASRATGYSTAAQQMWEPGTPGTMGSKSYTGNLTATIPLYNLPDIDDGGYYVFKVWASNGYGTSPAQTSYKIHFTSSDTGVGTESSTFDKIVSKLTSCAERGVGAAVLGGTTAKIVGPAAVKGYAYWTKAVLAEGATKISGPIAAGVAAVAGANEFLHCVD